MVLKAIFGSASWDENYFNFNPSRYSTFSERAFNATNLRQSGESVQLRVEFYSTKEMTKNFSFNSVLIVNTSTAQRSYYFIKAVNAIAAGVLQIECIADSLMNYYMFKSKDLIINTLKIGSSNISSNKETFNSLDIYEKDLLVKSNTEYLDVNKSSQVALTANGSAIFQANGSYYNQIPLNNYPIDQPSGSVSSINADSTYGKDVTNKLLYFESNPSFGGINLNSSNIPALNYNFIGYKNALNSKVTQISARFGNDMVDLTPFIDTSNLYNNSRFMFFIDNDLYSNISSDYLLRGQRNFSLFPASFMTVGVKTDNDLVTNRRVLFSRRYQLPRSQQMYSKYIKWLIDNKHVDKARQAENFIKTIFQLLGGGLNAISGTFDFGEVFGPAASYASFLINRDGQIKDLMEGFVETVGQQPQDFRDIIELISSGFEIIVKTLSDDTIKAIQTKAKNEGFASYQQLTIESIFLQNITYIEGIAQMNNAEFTDNKIITAFKRGIYFYK